jgi:hypothetical protein
MRFAELAIGKYRAVWVSETGQEPDTEVEDWYCFWWNDKAELDGGYEKPEGRGRGYRYSGSWQTLVKYEPIDDLRN